MECLGAAQIADDLCATAACEPHPYRLIRATTRYLRSPRRREPSSHLRRPGYSGPPAQVWRPVARSTTRTSSASPPVVPPRRGRAIGGVSTRSGGCSLVTSMSLGYVNESDWLQRQRRGPIKSLVRGHAGALPAAARRIRAA